MDTFTIPDELRSPVDEVRRWLCRPERMPDSARTAARSLLALVFHDLDLIDGVVRYFVNEAEDEAYADRLPVAAQFAIDLAGMERDKRRASNDAARLVVERASRRPPLRRQ